MTTALLLIAHGSRQPEANDDLRHVAQVLRGTDPARMSATIVQASFLELAEPSIPEGARLCIAAGARRVVMLPYFLSAGLHVREDLQRFRDELSAAYPGAEFILAEPLGRHPLLIEIVLERAAKALGGLDSA
jgi:sirohydrochlorin ferrochelatase